MNNSKIIPYLLVLPVSLLSLLFIVGIANGLLQSFGVIPALGLYTPTLKYYQGVFSRPDLLSSIGISLYITLLSSLGAAVLGSIICHQYLFPKRTVAASSLLLWPSKFAKQFSCFAFH